MPIAAQKKKQQQEDEDGKSDEGEIPSERLHTAKGSESRLPPVFKSQSHCVLTAESFEVHKIPSTVGCDGVSKRIFENSTHFKRNSQWLTDRNAVSCKTCTAVGGEKEHGCFSNMLCLSHKGSMKDTKESEDTLRARTEAAQAKLAATLAVPAAVKK